MVNKTTSFKKKGKGKKKGNFKKKNKQVAAQEKKPKSGPKPETECFYYKQTGHWKRNCLKYLADKKDGKVNKGICDIHVIDVYLTNARSSTWVSDTGSVANICNSKQGLQIKRTLEKGRGDDARGKWFQSRCDRCQHATSISTFGISFRPE